MKHQKNPNYLSESNGKQSCAEAALAPVWAALECFCLPAHKQCELHQDTWQAKLIQPLANRFIQEVTNWQRSCWLHIMMTNRANFTPANFASRLLRLCCPAQAHFSRTKNSCCMAPLTLLLVPVRHLVSKLYHCSSSHNLTLYLYSFMRKDLLDLNIGLQVANSKFA